MRARPDLAHRARVAARACRQSVAALARQALAEAVDRIARDCPPAEWSEAEREVRREAELAEDLAGRRNPLPGEELRIDLRPGRGGGRG